MMVVQMEGLLTNTPSYMGRVYNFMGFPAPVPHKLPDRNEKDFSFTVHSIDCGLKQKLRDLYLPWNQDLYALLKNDATSGSAPSSEPSFPTFPDLVKCHSSSNLTNVLAAEPEKPRYEGTLQ